MLSVPRLQDLLPKAWKSGRESQNPKSEVNETERDGGSEVETHRETTGRGTSDENTADTDFSEHEQEVARDPIRHDQTYVREWILAVTAGWGSDCWYRMNDTGKLVTAVPFPVLANLRPASQPFMTHSIDYGWITPGTREKMTAIRTGHQILTVDGRGVLIAKLRCWSTEYTWGNINMTTATTEYPGIMARGYN
jgi:hypothetical protein